MQIEEFINDIKVRGYAVSTQTAYRRELKHFAAFLKTKRLRVTQVRAKMIMQYVQAPSLNRAPNWSTTGRKLAALSSYFDFLHVTSDGRIRNPVRLVRRPKRQKPNPKLADSRTLDTLISGITNTRDRAIVMLFRSSGLRLSELVSLDRESIRMEETVLPVGKRVLGVGRVTGKGGNERDFLVDLKTVRQLRLYLKERGDDSLTPLFLSNRGKRIDKSTIQEMLATWCRKLNLPKVHPHSIRHSAATFWHRQGIDNFQIRDLLGHSSVAVTNQYIHPDSARLRAQYFAAMETQTSTAELNQDQEERDSARGTLVAGCSERIVNSVANSTQTDPLENRVDRSQLPASGLGHSSGNLGPHVLTRVSPPLP
jgi:site-specific recombinase XerC